jgi:hypothetical protein
MMPPPALGRASPRPALELADVIRRHGSRLEDITCEQQRVLNALAACRTAVLGGHVETCDHCQHQRIAYNSCRNRHCPKCQASACAHWMEARATELLPVEYFHVVFTLPNVFNGLALANKRVVYGVLFEAVSQTLLEVAADPKHLGARIGFLAILHTWGQNLSLHPHLHCVIPGGGLTPDGTRWISCRPGFFLPVRVLSRVFRGKFIDVLRKEFERGRLRGVADAGALEILLDQSVRTDWVVYAKPPFGGPSQVLKYLSRYTHKIAISNRRLASMTDQTITFRWKDYARGSRPRMMTLDATEFLRRFLLHVVPRGFMRIRHFGLLANRFRTTNIEQCRKLLSDSANCDDIIKAAAPDNGHATEDHERCPICRCGRMIKDGRIVPKRPLLLLTWFNDTS